MSWVASRPERLIDFLKTRKTISLASIKSIRRALEANSCRVNGKIERFASRRLLTGDLVEFVFAPQKKEEKPKLDVIFEDEFFKVVDKPPGFICDEASTKRFLGPRHFLIHRLDRDTSGLLLIAKQIEVKSLFISLFEQKKVSKLYLALSDGVYPRQSALKESYLAKKGTFAGQTIWGSIAKSPRGLNARTEFETVARGDRATLFACRPITGRTHQIRVHLAELGHPILIDRQYAEAFRCPHPFSRILLHAASLAFPHPITGEKMEITAPLPRDMRSAIDLVGISSRHVSQFLSEQEKTDRWDERRDDKDPKEAIQTAELFHPAG